MKYALAFLLITTGALAQYICAPYGRDTIIVSLNGNKFPCTLSTMNTERVTVKAASNPYFLLAGVPGPELLVIRNGLVLDTAQKGGSNDYVIRGNRIDMTPTSGALDLGGKLFIGDKYRFIYTIQGVVQ